MADVACVAPILLNVVFENAIFLVQVLTKAKLIEFYYVELTRVIQLHKEKEAQGHVNEKLAHKLHYEACWKKNSWGNKSKSEEKNMDRGCPSNSNGMSLKESLWNHYEERTRN